MIGRRKFLQAFGVGAAAAPIAAKAAAEDALKSVTSLRGWDHPPLTGPMSSSHAGIPVSSVASAPGQKLLSFVRAHGGLPAHVERQLRERAGYVNHFDADIASKRAWSFNVKIQEQRRRNYERLVAETLDNDWFSVAQKKFTENFGFSWPWH